ncbi:DUF4159 domain-containing protein [Acidisoma sp. 7E03]
MIFGAPWLLLAFLFLPVLWWLVRASPPAPRRQSFPALRLLAGLETQTESPERTPPWLLLLRLFALACLITGLAGPILNPRTGPVGGGPLLLVIDNSWATASDWADRLAAARAAISTAARDGRPVALLATAAELDGTPPAILGPMPAARAENHLAAVMPHPWSPDRAADARALGTWHAPDTSVLFIDDGILAPSGEAAFRRALGAAGTVTELRAPADAPLLLPPANRAGQRLVRMAALPLAVDRSFAVLAEGADGRRLTRVSLSLPAGQTIAEAPLGLPTSLANEVTALRLAGAPSAGGTLLLDGQWRRRIVGLASADGANADAPLVGPLYYLNRALGPDVEIRHGTLDELLAEPLSALILSDRPLPPGPERDAVAHFVEQGGLLIRFGGPLMAESGPDPLLPVHLLQQDRSLGGALSWNKPEHLAAFPATSPFAGLTVPQDLTVRRQLLADPASLGQAAVWATLTDGTPLVSSAPLGRGRIVLFHVTADADWSNLPLSGLFPALLDRLVQLAAGLGETNPQSELAPVSVLNGYGELGPASGAAAPVRAGDLAHLLPSPKTPPGFYGAGGDRRAFNLGGALPDLAAAPTVPGASQGTLGGGRNERALGPALTAAGLLLLILDLLASLALRGALGPLRRGSRRKAAALMIALSLALAPRAQAAGAPQVPAAALQTSLAYVITGNTQVDALSATGLSSLSDFVTSRSAAILGDPAGVVPGRDDLSLYPLLYWPVVPGMAALAPDAIAALNRFMAGGGILLIDTEGSDSGAPGSGAGMQPGASAALRAAVEGLDVPPLTPLDPRHVLAHSFYLLRSFPGRFVGAPVWVARNPETSNDGVSPIIIGANDWVAAWAMNQDGSFPFSTVPGSDEQRLYAYRFGMNLVMYALTGTYKGDQVHVPSILERLGQ